MNRTTFLLAFCLATESEIEKLLLLDVNLIHLFPVPQAQPSQPLSNSPENHVPHFQLMKVIWALLGSRHKVAR